MFTWPDKSQSDWTPEEIERVRQQQMAQSMPASCVHPMTPEIERLAAAARAEVDRQDGKYEPGTASAERATQIVRVVLEALREPTEELSEFMSQQAANGMVDWRDLHRAMIDHVLGK